MRRARAKRRRQRGDVGSVADVERAVDAGDFACYEVDVVVNNAGIMIFKSIQEHSQADILKVLRVDFLGVFWFTEQVLRKCGRASIVNVSSIDAIETTPPPPTPRRRRRRCR